MDISTGDSGHVVLIVDDDPVCRFFCEHALAASGYRTFTANDGDSAVYSALHEKPQVVLTDIHLPDMSGTEVITKIRQLWPEAGTLPRFVALSGDDSTMPRNAVRDISFDYSLIKPFSIAALLASVEKAENEFSHVSKPIEPDYGPCNTTSVQKPLQATELQLQSVFRMELNQQLSWLDQSITALDWARATETLHRLSGAAAFAGFSAFARTGRVLLRQLSQPQDIALIAQTYLEFLHQAKELSGHQPPEANPAFRHHE